MPLRRRTGEQRVLRDPAMSQPMPDLPETELLIAARRFSRNVGAPLRRMTGLLRGCLQLGRCLPAWPAPLQVPILHRYRGRFEGFPYRESGPTPGRPGVKLL